jgi:hypothetical protein
MIRQAGHNVCKGEMREAYGILVRKAEIEISFGKLGVDVRIILKCILIRRLKLWTAYN